MKKAIKVYQTDFEHYPGKENGKYPEKYRGSIIFLKRENWLERDWCRFISPDGKISHSFNKSTWEFFKNNTPMTYIQEHTIHNESNISEHMFNTVKNDIHYMNKNQLQVLSAYIDYELHEVQIVLPTNSRCKHCGCTL